MKIELQHVRYMPNELDTGVLYVSKEFSTAAHLCPCGCGSKIRTPLGQTEWDFEETEKGPSLYPSIGNWQLPCRSHYFIYRGRICWAKQWTDEEIAAGRSEEEERRSEYFESLYPEKIEGVRRMWHWVKHLWGR